MNKIFFLGDENAIQLFYRNPRPYLVPIKPKPVYKIIVMGSLLSGRSVIARALSNMFNLAYINPKEIEDEYMQEKNQVYLDSVRSAAIVEGNNVMIVLLINALMFIFRHTKNNGVSYKRPRRKN